MNGAITLFMALDFNSRTHVECGTVFRIFRSIGSPISTHALTWSAAYPAITVVGTRTFQLTHSRGVRLLSVYRLDLIQVISTHALTWSAAVTFYY